MLKPVSVSVTKKVEIVRKLTTKRASVFVTKKVEIVHKLATKPASVSATQKVEIVRKLATKPASASATKKIEMVRKLTTKHDMVCIFLIYFISLTGKWNRTFNEMPLIIMVGNGYYKYDRGGVVRYIHVPTKTADKER